MGKLLIKGKNKKQYIAETEKEIKMLQERLALVKKGKPIEIKVIKNMSKKELAREIIDRLKYLNKAYVEWDKRK